MVASALGKLGASVRLAERFDPTIAERELGYTDRRQLGDGTPHALGGGASPVPWLPYFGGSIAASDYYIIGGITELNYDIRSGGIETRVGQVGPKARTYTQSVAIDLRIVDTRSLLVAKTVSLTKQFTGYEVGFNLFRFFGSELFDINLGAKGQEPLQLGIRTALEEATLRLVAAVAPVDSAPCLARQSWFPPAAAPPAPDPSITRSADADRARGA
jgi:curli biogenesis system outer membrane secretion channel CsgG